MKHPFPEFIDATMRTAFSECPRKFYNEFILCQRPKGDSIHLVAGKAFAGGIEMARRAFHDQGLSPEASLLAGTRELMRLYGEPDRFSSESKSLSSTLVAFYEYFDHYGFRDDHLQPVRNTNGASAIEFSFAVPIPGTVHPTTGCEIIWCGRFDMVAHLQDTPGLFGVDEKTTGSIGGSWATKWRHRTQFTGYVWGAGETGMPLVGMVARGVAILKTKTGHAESIQYRPTYYVERWLTQMKRDIERMIQCYENDYWDFAFNDACSNYGACPFSDMCFNRDPEHFPPGMFEHARWNPVKVENTPLDEDGNDLSVEA